MAALFTKNLLLYGQNGQMRNEAVLKMNMAEGGYFRIEAEQRWKVIQDCIMSVQDRGVTRA